MITFKYRLDREHNQIDKHSISNEKGETTYVNLEKYNSELLHYIQYLPEMVEEVTVNDDGSEWTKTWRREFHETKGVPVAS